MISHQKDKVCFSVIDTSIIHSYIRSGVDVTSLVRTNPDVSDFYDGLKTAEENGYHPFFKADTVAELARKMGVNEENLVKTVADYNDLCDSLDGEFFKDARLWRPWVKPPCYGAQVRAAGYGTVGRIRINENCEACDKDFDPVPGLYAAGADACNIYDDSYMFLLPGNSMGFAVNSGRIAGMSAAAYVG